MSALEVVGHTGLVEKAGAPDYGFDWQCECSYGGHADTRAAAKDAHRKHALAAGQEALDRVANEGRAALRSEIVDWPSGSWS